MSIGTRRKRLIAFFLTVALFSALFAVSAAFAAGKESVSEQGLTVELVSGRQDWERPRFNEKVNYSLTVTNTGDQEVSGISVEDADGAFAAGSGYTVSEDGHTASVTGALAPGKKISVKSAHFVSEADILAGKMFCNMTVNADGKKEISVSADNLTEDAKYTMTVKKTSDAVPGVRLDLGDPLVYTTVIANTGNQALTNIFVNDPDAVITSEDNCKVSKDGHTALLKDPLAPGAEVSVSSTHTVNEQDISRFKVVGTVSVKADHTSDYDYTLENLAAIPTYELTAENISADTSKPDIDDKVSFTVKVKNVGNQTLENVRITDYGAQMQEGTDHSVIDGGQTAVFASMAPGEEKSVSLEHTVTEQDIHNGKVTSSALATGNKTRTVKAKYEVPTAGSRHSLGVEITADKKDAVIFDDTVTYTITVTNTGNRIASSVRVENTGAEMEPGEGLSVSGDRHTLTLNHTLMPGEKAVITAKHVVSGEDVLSGKAKDTVTAKSGYSENSFATIEIPAYEIGEYRAAPAETPEPAPAPIRTPEPTVKPEVVEEQPEEEIIDEEPIVPGETVLSVTVDSSLTENDTVYAGDVVAYDINVENIGKMKLTDVDIAVSMAGFTPAEGAVFSGITLNPGSIHTIRGTYEVTQSDVESGKTLRNLVTVNGNMQSGAAVGTANAEAVDTIRVQPVLFLSVKSDRTDAVKEGDVLNYTVKVRNDGNVILSDISLKDGLPEKGISAQSFTLEPGRTESFTVSHTVTADDVTAKEVVYNVSAEATYDETKKLTEEKSVTNAVVTVPVVDLESILADTPAPTGDDSRVLFWTVLCLLSGCSAAGIGLVRKRRKQD